MLFPRDSLSFEILKFLKASEAPIVDCRVLKHYFPYHKLKDILNSLQTLQRLGFIEKLGDRRHFRYVISSKGIDYLWSLEKEQMKEELEANLKVQIDKLWKRGV